MSRAIVFALLAVSLGPWVAALWATNGATKSGSSFILRRAVRVLFWLAFFAAAVEAIR